MFKQTIMAAAVLSASAWAGSAAAADYISLGQLVCGSDGGQGLIVTSEKNLICTYTPASGGQKAVYAGKIEKFGIDIGQTGKSVMIWQVLAKTGTNMPDFALAGEYYGIGADASLGAGGGAKVIAGGTDKAFMLQPLNLQAQEGLNLAIGVEKMTLVPGEI
jgi:Protein of unknown function (DUF992)